MKIGLLLGAGSETSAIASAGSLEEAVRQHLGTEGARLVVLPCEGVLAESLAFHAKVGDPARGLSLLVPVFAGGIEDDALSALAAADAARIAVVDPERTVDGRLSEGARLIGVGDLAAARDLLEKTARTIASELSPRSAHARMLLGALARREGRLTEAAVLIDQALAITPDHPSALRERLELARAADDSALAATLRMRLVAHADSDEERVRQLVAVVDDSLAAATFALRSAVTLRPGHRALLQRLRAVHEATGDFSAAVDAAVALAEATTEHRERARAFVAAADLCAKRAKNVGRAVALYEAAIADDPAVPGAFDAIESVLVDGSDFAGVERAYVRQLERLEAERSEMTVTTLQRVSTAELDLWNKLADVRNDRLGDWHGAVSALDRLIAQSPADLTARGKLARILEDNGETALAARCLEVMAERAPARVETYRALERVFRRLGDVDRCFATCTVLVHLGEADLDAQHVHHELAPRGALAPTQALDDAAWQLLYPDEIDRNLATIVGIIAPAAVAHRIDQLKVAGKLPRLDPKALQNLEQSTVSAVRTVGWAAKLIGVKTPAIYAKTEEVGTGIALVPALEPTVALGKSMLSGRSVPELTFRIAWELAYERVTGRLLHLYPSLAELGQLLVAAIALVLPETSLDAEGHALATALGSRLDVGQRQRLGAAVAALNARGGKVDLLGYCRAIERTACRAGLLASGDLTVAARIIAIDGRAAAGLSAADRIRDLVAFSIGERYARLRQNLGVALKGSIPARRSDSSELEVAIDVSME